jgi:hypothetical protein
MLGGNIPAGYRQGTLRRRFSESQLAGSYEYRWSDVYYLPAYKLRGSSTVSSLLG